MDLDQLDLVWKLWAAKEAGYKAFMQWFGKIPGSAALFEVDRDFSKVTFSNHSLQLAFQLSETYIYAIAYQFEGGFLSSDIVECDDSRHHSTVRKLASDLFAEKGTIVKNELGIPHFVTKADSIPVSLTHHGSYVAACRAFTNNPNLKNSKII